MKRFSSILFAVLLGTLTLVSNLRAQQYSGGAGPVDWQNALGTWNVPTFPGQLNDGTIAILAPTAAVTINNAGGIANRVRALQLNTNFGVTLNGTGTIVIGALNLNTAQALTIGAGLNVVIDSVIDGAAGSTIVVNAGATLTLRKGTNAPATQVLLGGTTLAAGSLSGSVVIENGFNGGIFPTNIFYTAPPAVGTAMTSLNAITVVAPMTINDNITTAAAGGVFTVNSGVLTVAAGGSLQLGQTGANSLVGTGTINSVLGGTVILGAAFNANIIPGQRFSNPFTGTLQLNGAANSNFTINSDMTFSPPNPTSAQQSILNLNGANPSFVTVPAGVTVRFNNTINNAIQAVGAGSQVLVNAGGTVVLGAGFNAGVIPSARFGTINGTLQTVGAMSLNVTGAPAGGMFSSSGQFEIGGDLSLAGAGTFEISQTGPNSIRATAGSNARISSPGPNTIVRFNANANNGVLPGCLFSNPFAGGMDIRSSMSLSCDLFMATNAGPLRFDATTVGVNTNIILTINSGVTLGLRQTIAGNLTGQVGGATPALCYIQGVNNTSNLILGLGANGGTVPSGAAAGAAPTIPCLPLSGIASFNGKLTLEGSLTLATNLEMGTGSILDLAGGNLTVQDTRTLRLANSGANSLIGTGVIQAVAPAGGAATVAYNNYRHLGQGTAGTYGSCVEIGPSMNGTVFPAARFANPFQGNIDFSTAGTLTVQGDFVHAVPNGRGYFVVGAITSTANITIGANSSVTLNSLSPSAFYGANIPHSPVPTFAGGAFQGTNQTSRLVIGISHANGISTAAGNPPASAYAVTTSGTFLAIPFNGTLAFASNTIIYTSATIGITGGLELGGTVVVTSGTRYGAQGAIGNSGHNRVNPTSNPAPTFPYYSPITITLNNQAANSISGLGTFLTATGNTLVFGTGSNGGIIPGARLASPHFGTIATVGAMTLQGNLTIGDLRDGFSDISPPAAASVYLSSGFLKLGDRLTIDNAAVLTVSNATAQPFSTRFGGNSDAFQTSTGGTGVIQANPNGELRLLDGFNARNRGGSSAWTPGTAAVPPMYAVSGAVTSTSRNEISSYIPKASFIDPGFLASPFNGKLFIGSDMPQDGHATLAARSFTGGFSRFNITTGTLNIGATGFLSLISPLYVSAGTASLVSGNVLAPFTNDNGLLNDGYPRVILGQTGANSFVGVTTGSFLQSSVGTFQQTAPFAAASPFFMGVQHGNSITGGSVQLGTGFNANIIPGAMFGVPYSGRLVMPQTGTYTLVGNLTMNSGTPGNQAAFAAGDGVAATSPAGNLNFGILHLGLPGATSVLQVQDGSQLQLGTTGSLIAVAGSPSGLLQLGNFATNLYPYGIGSGRLNPSAAIAQPAPTAAPQGQGMQSLRALQGSGTIQGLGNNARVIIPGTMNDTYVTAANFANPFNGRLVIATSANMYLVGDLAFGAVGTSNGVLDISTPITPANQPLFVPVGTSGSGLHQGSSITFNNISPVSVVLPGAGAIVATSNYARIIVGPNALANILPAAQLRQPFVGQLIVTSGSTSAYAMNANLTLAQDDPTNVTGTDLFGLPGVQTGFLRTFADINIASGITLGVRNTSMGALSGTGTFQGTDNSSTVRYFTGTLGAGTGVPANGGIIGTTVQSPAAITNPRFGTPPAGGFRNPFIGTIQTDMGQTVAAPAANEPSRNVYTLFGRVTLGAPASSNGVLNASGATIFVGAADINGAALGINSTVGNLVVNNVSGLATSFPGAGRVTPKGMTNLAVAQNGGNPAPMSPVNAGGNGSIVFGPGAIGSTFPGDRFTAASAIGTAVANDQRNEAPWNAEVRGTVMTSTGSVTATAANLTFANGGTLLVGGLDNRYVAEPQRPTVLVSTLNTLSVPNGTVYTINTTHRSAFGGNGALLLGATTASLVYGAGANEGVLYGEHLGVHNAGQLTFNSNIDLRGNLRHGLGGRNEGTVLFNLGSAMIIGTSSTLDLRLQTARVTASATPGAAGLIRAFATTNTLSTAPQGITATLIFGPDYGRFTNNAASGTGEVDRLQGNIGQGLPFLDNSAPTVAASTMNAGFGGTIITSTGSISVTEGNFSLQGALEMGGIVNLEGAAAVSRTFAFNNWGANSFRATAGSNGQLRTNPDGNGTGAVNARLVLGPTPTSLSVLSPANATQYSFNGGILPSALIARSNGSAAANGLPIDGITTNAFGATRGTAQLDINGSKLTLSGNLYAYGDVNFTSLGGDLNIPANTTLTINGGFAQAAAGTNRGVITASDNTGTLAIAPAARTNAVGGTFDQTDNTLTANSPQLGGRNAAGFTGKLLLLSSRFFENAAGAGNNALPNPPFPNNLGASNLGVQGITVTIATTGLLDMESTRSTIVLRDVNARLNLNNTPENSLFPTLVAAQSSGLLKEATTAIISLSAPSGATGTLASTVATVSFGANFDGGTIPGNLLSAYRLQGGATYIMNSNLSLSSEMFVSTTGTWNFNAGTNKLTLGAFNMTVNGALSNADQNRYFVTNGAGLAGLNGVGNVTFPVGPTSALYTPINIVNNAAPSLFSVRAVSPLAPITAPLAAAAGSTVQQAVVGVRWNVVQNNNVAQGLAVTLTPQWPAGQEGAGFTRTLAVVNRYASNVLAQSSTPAVASAVPTLANYFQSSLVVSQTATPGLLTAGTDIVVSSQPTPTILSFTPASAASSQTVTIVGQRFVNVSAVRFGGVNAASFTVSAAGDTIRAVVGQGATGVVTVVQTGGTATSATNFTYLGAPPQTPVLINATPQPISAGLGDVQMTITGTGFGSNTVRVVASGSGAQGTIIPISNSATSITFTLPGQFSRNVGSVTLTVTSLDKNPVSTNVTVAVAPATTLTSITPSTTTGNLQAHTVFITGTAFGPQSTFSLNGTALRVMSFVTNQNGTLTAGVEIPVGAVSGNVVVTNLNNTTAQLPFSITNLPRPIITGVNPAAIAPGSGDRLVTVTGLNLIPGAVVTFNGVAIGNVTTTSTSVQFVVPASLLANPDLATIRITNPDNQSIGYRFPISNGLGEAPVFPTTPNGAPLAGVINPSSTNATAQAFQLVLTGQNIASNATVSFGGTPVTVARRDGSTVLVINIPANLNVAGTYQIQVANSINAVVSLPFMIGPALDRPAISIVNRQGGNLVITGSNFRQGATVQLGSTVLTVSALNSTSITAAFPGLPAGTYTLIVTNPDGQFASVTYIVTSVQERFVGTRMYPNPTVDVVNVEATLERSAEVVITISNTLGQRVMTVRQNAAAGFFSKSVNIQNLPTGAYTVEITDGTRRSVEKIIKN